MKGHIRQRGKGSWAIVLDIGPSERGKRKQKWHTVQGSKRDAQRALNRLLHEIQSGDYVEPARMTVAEYLARWLRDSAKARVAPKTYERYEELVRLHLSPALGSHALPGLKALHIQAYYTQALERPSEKTGHRLSPTTVLHIHRLLHEALKQAVRWQLINRNPSDVVEPPRMIHHEMRALDGSEIKQMVAALQGHPMCMPVVLAVATGMRRGEILALRWSDTDLESGTVTVQQSLEVTRAGLAFKQPKSRGSRRLVTLPAFAVEALRKHRAQQAKTRLRLGPAFEDNGLVCPGPDGKPWNPDNLTSAFRKFVRRRNLPIVRFHDLRHSHATQLLQLGLHPKVVSERLGHSTIGITLDTYSHVLPGMQQEAASKLDIALRVESLDVRCAE